MANFKESTTCASVTNQNNNTDTTIKDAFEIMLTILQILDKRSKNYKLRPQRQIDWKNGGTAIIIKLIIAHKNIEN